MKIKNLLLVTITFLSFVEITNAQIPNYVPTSGLVVWYPFNGNANDESGNGNNGTVTGPVLIPDRFGYSDSAYFFDGSIGSIISANPSLPIGNTSRTISLWMNSTNLSGSGGINQNILVQYGNGNTVSQSCEIGFDQGYLYFTTYATNTLATSLLIADGIWHNIVFTYDGTIRSLYADGVLINSASSGIAFATTSTDLWFGERHNEVVAQKLDGSLDDIGIWDRVLTQQEISDLYNNCALSFTVQPINQSSFTDLTVQFTATNNITATYQWQTDLGAGYIDVTDAGQYSGATTNTLTISNLTMGNNNQLLRCIVEEGACSDTSDIAVLTVVDASGLENQTTQTISIYPNPTTSQIFFDFGTTPVEGLTIRIDNILGQTILKQTLNQNQFVINLSELASKGTYFVYVVDENEVVEIRKIILQ